jgi:hypothetical protein
MAAGETGRPNLSMRARDLAAEPEAARWAQFCAWFRVPDIVATAIAATLVSSTSSTRPTFEMFSAGVG